MGKHTGLAATKVRAGHQGFYSQRKSHIRSMTFRKSGDAVLQAVL